MAKYGSSDSGKKCGPDIKQRPLGKMEYTPGGGFTDKGYKLGTSGGYECADQVKGSSQEYSPKDPNRD